MTDTFLLHALNRFVAAAHVAHKVSSHELMRFGVLCIDYGTGVTGSVVDENVHAAQAFIGFFEDAFNIALFRLVGGDAIRLAAGFNFFESFLQIFFAAPKDKHTRATLHQNTRRSEPDAGG